MRLSLVNLFFVQVLLLFLVVSSVDIFENRLSQVFVVSRHGMRTPHELYPSDPYRSSSFWPEGWMKLTKEGSEQMKKLGQYLRRRYGFFLPSIYEPSVTLIRSTDTSRTINSALALLSGLYPNQSVPVITEKDKSDEIFNAYKKCPAYDEEIKLVRRNNTFVEEESKRSALYEFLTFHLGKRVNSITSTERIYNSFLIEESRGLVLPRWSKAIYPEPIRSLAGKSMAMGASTTLSARLRYGPLWRNIINGIVHTGRNRTNHKFTYYSGHDLTLVGLLSVLRKFNGIPPGFASALIIEVHENIASSVKFLKFYYRSSYKSDFYEIMPPECGVPCILNSAVDMLLPYLPIDLAFECKRKEAIFEKPLSLGIKLIAPGICLILISIGFIILYTMRTIYYHRYGANFGMAAGYIKLL